MYCATEELGVPFQSALLCFASTHFGVTSIIFMVIILNQVNMVYAAARAVHLVWRAVRLLRTAKSVLVQVLEKKYLEQSRAPVPDLPQEQHRDRSREAARGLVWVPARAVLEGFYRDR